MSQAPRQPDTGGPLLWFVVLLICLAIYLKWGTQ